MKAPASLLAVLFLLAFGCGRAPRSATPPSPFHGRPPHGGTAVVLGDGDYNLELVRDAGAATLSVYVLDDDLENFIRSPDPALTLVVRTGAGERRLVLAAVANPATGETVGDTSLFQGRAAWLGPMGHFAGTVQGIDVHGTHFSAIPFDFPANPGRH